MTAQSIFDAEHALGRLPEPEETANLHMTPDHNFWFQS